MPGEENIVEYQKRLSNLERDLAISHQDLIQATKLITEAKWLLVESKQYLGSITEWRDRRDAWLETPVVKGMKL